MRSIEQKRCAVIQTPIESTFLEEFNQNGEKTEWRAKVQHEYGEKIQNLFYPLVIERIIHVLVVRNRSDEIFQKIETYLQLYHEYEMSNILNIELSGEETLKKSWPMYLCGEDKQGHAVFYDDLMSLDVQQIVATFNEIVDENISPYDTQQKEREMLDLCLKYRFKCFAKMSVFKQLQSKKYNTLIFKHIIVMDFSNFSYMQIASNWSMFAAICQSIIVTEQLLYPESLHRLYLINCPWSFSMVWKFVRSIADDPKTVEKIHILGADYLQEMLKDIDIDQIPVKYGGKMDQTHEDCIES